jgi:outer membrane protein TolC
MTVVREAMLERPAQAKALPNPMLSYGGMDMANGGDWPDTNEKRVMVQQEFPWFGKRALREGIAAKEAESMRRELEAMTRDVVMTVKESFYDLYAVQQVITVTHEEETVLGRMAKIAETRYASGNGSQADLIKAQTEITMLKQRLLELRAQENTVKAKLNTLLNRRANEPLGTLSRPPAVGAPGEAAALFAEAARNRPEVLAAETQIERYGLEKKLMEKEYLPDYKLGLEYRDIQSEDNMLMFTVSVE